MFKIGDCYMKGYIYFFLDRCNIMYEFWCVFSFVYGLGLLLEFLNFCIVGFFCRNMDNGVIWYNG